MSAYCEIQENGTCKVLAYIPESFSARKIKHLANIETKHRLQSSVSDQDLEVPCSIPGPATYPGTFVSLFADSRRPISASFQQVCAHRMTCREILKFTVILIIIDTPK